MCCDDTAQSSSSPLWNVYIAPDAGVPAQVGEKTSTGNTSLSTWGRLEIQESVRRGKNNAQGKAGIKHSICGKILLFLFFTNLTAVYYKTRLQIIDISENFMKDRPRNDILSREMVSGNVPCPSSADEIETLPFFIKNTKSLIL